jgi:alanine racemase
VTIRLAVNETRWQDHVQSVARSMPGMVPVVKGNGYGFRRWNLMPLAGQLAAEVAVGTVYEVRDVPAWIVPIVLTPTLTVPPQNMPRNAVLTVGSLDHLRALVQHGWRGEVMVKLQSSVMRFGASPAEFVPLVEELRRNHFTIHGYAIHPPLEGDPTNHVRDIEKWMRLVPNDAPVYVSHLDAPTYEHVRSRHPERAWRIRLGSALWHGDKSMMQLSADVLDHHPVETGMRAGYRQIAIAGPGQVVVVGCGTAHGVRLLDDGRSPFHYQRQRLNVLEPPHMHVSMLLLARGRPIPPVGEWIDVQQPLTRVQVDLLQWIR